MVYVPVADPLTLRSVAGYGAGEASASDARGERAGAHAKCHQIDTTDTNWDVRTVFSTYCILTFDY